RGDAILAAILAVAAVGGVLATQSRTGLVVLGVAAFVYAILLVRRGGRGSLGAILGLLVAVPGVWMLYTRLPEARALTLDDENFQSRQDIWADAWAAFGQAPILGHGLNYAGQSRFGPGLSAHNEYLAQMV